MVKWGEELTALINANYFNHVLQLAIKFYCSEKYRKSSELITQQGWTILFMNFYYYFPSLNPKIVEPLILFTNFCKTLKFYWPTDHFNVHYVSEEYLMDCEWTMWLFSSTMHNGRATRYMVSVVSVPPNHFLLLITHDYERFYYSFRRHWGLLYWESYYVLLLAILSLKRLNIRSVL